jgi:hypothetical protein
VVLESHATSSNQGGTLPKRESVNCSGQAEKFLPSPWLGRSGGRPCAS